MPPGMAGTAGTTGTAGTAGTAGTGPLQKFDEFTINRTKDGESRSDKFIRDIELLKGRLTEGDMNNGRYWFYLGQSLRDLGKYEEAIPCYLKRAKLGGCQEEVYFSYFQMGVCMMKSGKPFGEFRPYLLRAYWTRPHRLEALHTLVRHCRLNKMPKLGYAYGGMAKHSAYPKDDSLFVDKDIHEWRFWDELAIVAHYSGDYELAISLGEKILREKKYPDRESGRMYQNLEFYAKGKETAQQLKSKEIAETNDKSNTNDTKSTVSSGKLGACNFVRIMPGIKDFRIAMILTNYNMAERADQMVEFLKETCQWPLDIILVDNGSDKVQPSKYTSLYLGQNVQTTHGWLMGLNYADSLEINEGFKYFAYGFVITSAELLANPVSGKKEDVMSPLGRVLMQHDDVVGVHPALSKDSTTWWTQLIVHKENGGPRITNMIDNIFSIYRADWFNGIGRFEKLLTYAWGIDIETSYYARRDRKKLVVHDDVVVKKVTNIGYSMDRMGMSSGDRVKNAQKQMNGYFTEKYGDDWNQTIMDTNRVQEFTKLEPNK